MKVLSLFFNTARIVEQSKDRIESHLALSEFLEAFEEEIESTIKLLKTAMIDESEKQLNESYETAMFQSRLEILKQAKSYLYTSMSKVVLPSEIIDETLYIINQTIVKLEDSQNDLLEIQIALIDEEKDRQMLEIEESICSEYVTMHTTTILRLAASLAQQ